MYCSCTVSIEYWEKNSFTFRISRKWRTWWNAASIFKIIIRLTFVISIIRSGCKTPENQIYVNCTNLKGKHCTKTIAKRSNKRTWKSWVKQDQIQLNIRIQTETKYKKNKRANSNYAQSVSQKKERRNTRQPSRKFASPSPIICIPYKHWEVVSCSF